MFRQQLYKSLMLLMLLAQFSSLAHAIEHQLSSEHAEECVFCVFESDPSGSVVKPNDSHTWHFKSGHDCSLADNYCSINHHKGNIRAPPQYL